MSRTAAGGKATQVRHEQTGQGRFGGSGRKVGLGSWPTCSYYQRKSSRRCKVTETWRMQDDVDGRDEGEKDGKKKKAAISPTEDLMLRVRVGWVQGRTAHISGRRTSHHPWCMLDPRNVGGQSTRRLVGEELLRRGPGGRQPDGKEQRGGDCAPHTECRDPRAIAGSVLGHEWVQTRPLDGYSAPGASNSGSGMPS